MQGRGAVRLFEREGSGLAATAVVFLLLSLTLQTVKASVDLEPIIEGPVEVEVGEPASFDATSSGGAIINYTWDFRDGSFAFGPDVEHSFQREGTYLVGLTITDIEGRQALGTHMMRVVNSPPVAAAEARLDFGEIRPLDLVDLPGLQHVEVSEDQTFLLSAAASSDAPPDVPGLKYAWSLGDGRTASGRHVVVSYPDAGLYRVILQVVDPHGAFDTDEVLVRVVNVPPTAVLGHGQDGLVELAVYEDQAVVLEGVLSTDTLSDRPTLTYSWDLGDGGRASGPRVVHLYPRPGRYEVTLTVTDDNGESSADRLWVSVRNRPPALESLQPGTVNQGSALLLAAEAWDDPTDAPGLRYLWNGQEGGQEALLSWSEPGRYDIALAVVDDDGAAAATGTTVEVINVAPHVSLSDAYAQVDVEAYLTGEPGNRVLLEVLRGDETMEQLVLERRRGRPADGAQALRSLQIRLDDLWFLRGTYLPAGDGQGDGSNPLFVFLTLEDGRRVSLHHDFDTGDPSTWTWTETVNSFLGGVPVHMTATVFDPGSDDLVVAWSFDGGQGPIQALPAEDALFRDLESLAVHAVEIPRKGDVAMPVTVRAVDENGGVGSAEIVLSWNGAVLFATGLGPKVEPLDSLATEEGMPLLFSAEAISSSRASPKFSWDMGDGTVADGKDVEHVYDRPGIYLARILVEAGGQRTVRGSAVLVEDVPPTAATRIEGQRVQDSPLVFDASQSGSASSWRAGFLYHWDFGDGAQAVGPTVLHGYSWPGTYRVTLTVVDPQGSVDRSEATVEIANVAPHPRPLVAYRGEQDQTLRVEAPLTDTPTDAARLSYDWLPGPGALMGRSLTLSYGRPGEHLLWVVASDGSLLAKAVVPVSVENRDPEGHAPSITYYGPRRAVRLEALGADAPSDLASLSFQWRFGDGQERWGRTAYHLYPATGEYTGELVVRDPWGAEDRVPFTVMVTYDGDGDGLSTEMEASFGTSDQKADTDGDGLLDWVEALYPDTDEDGLWDGTNTTVAGLLLAGEESLGTDPTNPDSDGDGLLDGQEVKGWDVAVRRFGEEVRYRVRSDPLMDDGDEDGLTDVHERLAGTDPGRWDTDGDDLWDDADPNARDDDTDGDGVSDGLDRVPSGTASLSFETVFPPGLARFQQPFSVFSVEGLYAWVYKYNYVGSVCQFVSDETATATRSSVVDASAVLDEVKRTFAEGGEVNYTPTQARELYEQGASFLHFTYGGCGFWSPNQYRLGYAVVEDKWAVDFVNVGEIEIPDGFGGFFQQSVETIPVRRGHPISLIIQYTLPAEEDRTFYADAGNFSVAAFGYSVFASDPVSEEALYANTAVAAGLEGNSYQIEIKIPGSVTAQATGSEEGGALTLLLLPAWLEVRPFGLTKRSWDTKNVVWASLSLKVPLFAYEIIPKLNIDLAQLQSYLPQDLEKWQTGTYTFGPYKVSLYNAGSGLAFDESLLAQVDAVVLIAVSESDLVFARETIDWGQPATWYREQGDAFDNRLRWFKTAQKSGSLSLLFLRFYDLRNLQLGGSVDLPEIPSEVSGRNVRLQVAVVTEGQVPRYNAYLLRPVAVKQEFPGLSAVREVVKVDSLGSFEDLEDIPHLDQRHARLKAAVRGAGIGVILATLGRTGVVAFAEGDVIRGSVYTAATSTAIFGQVLGEATLKKLGIRGVLGDLKLGTAMIIATGAILASYALFKAATTQDQISQLAHFEQASAHAIDTGVVLIPGYGAAILGSWTITVAALSIIMPGRIAARVVSSPGAAVTFVIEYVFSGNVPSAISEDAFTQTANMAVSRMRQWNSVFQIPSVVILPVTNG